MFRRFLWSNKILKITISLIGLITLNSFAQDMAVPANLQAALFKKIFSFDKTLTAKGSVEVAVIGSGADQIVAAFKDAGINAKAASDIGSASVVYIMPGTASLKSQSASKGVLSISGVTSYVENGNVAIGLGVEGGKPKIIINMSQLKAEGQELSSDLLKIAKVIQ
jgi:YfiR/HmsC-like